LGAAAAAAAASFNGHCCWCCRCCCQPLITSCCCCCCCCWCQPACLPWFPVMRATGTPKVARYSDATAKQSREPGHKRCSKRSGSGMHVQV
jgi:hypothetical protein